MRVKSLLEGVVQKDPMKMPEWLKKGRRRPTFSDEEILKALEANDGNIQDTAKALPLGYFQVRNVARRHGVYDQSKQRKRGNGSGRRKINVDLDQVTKRRAAGETMTDIARSIGVGSHIIYKRLKESRQK